MYIVRSADGGHTQESYGLRETAIERALKLNKATKQRFEVVDEKKVLYGFASDGQFSWANHIIVEQGTTQGQLEDKEKARTSLRRAPYSRAFLEWVKQ